MGQIVGTGHVGRCGKHTGLHTAACDLLGCEYPVILAGMGGVARAELVAAVSKAGGYGFLGMVREPAEFILAQIRAVRAHTNREFGVNLIPAATSPALLDQQVAVCLSEHVSSVSLFWEVPPELVARFRRACIIVVAQVGSAEEAERAVDAGADMIVAQGIGAGGIFEAFHNGKSCSLRSHPAAMCQLPWREGSWTARDRQRPYRWELMESCSARPF